MLGLLNVPVSKMNVGSCMINLAVGMRIDHTDGSNESPIQGHSPLKSTAYGRDLK
jgi:hypothetical protein